MGNFCALEKPLDDYRRERTQLQAAQSSAPLTLVRGYVILGPEVPPRESAPGKLVFVPTGTKVRPVLTSQRSSALLALALTVLGTCQMDYEDIYEDIFPQHAP